jgi:hypothetical protein
MMTSGIIETTVSSPEPLSGGGMAVRVAPERYRPGRQEFSSEQRVEALVGVDVLVGTAARTSPHPVSSQHAPEGFALAGQVLGRIT